MSKQPAPATLRNAILRAGNIIAVNDAVAAAREAELPQVDSLRAYRRAQLVGQRWFIGKPETRWLKSCALSNWTDSAVLPFASTQTLGHRRYLVTCNRHAMAAVELDEYIPAGLYALDTSAGEIARAKLDATYPSMASVYDMRLSYYTEEITVTGETVHGKTRLYIMSNGQHIERKYLDATQKLRKGHGPMQFVGLFAQPTRPMYIDAAGVTGMIMPFKK